jgi:methenyltetrahydrofolate cyclohydrolase
VPAAAPTDPLSSLPLGELLERLAARTPAPGGGSAAAVTACLAAGLVEMASAFDASPDAPGRRRRAAEVRERLLELADRDMVSYEPVLEALRRPDDDPGRAAAVSSALSAAAETPLGIARAAAEVTGLAQAAAEAANRHLLGDSAAAALLGEAACAAAALLVEGNLSRTADPRRAEAEQLARDAVVVRQRVQIRARRI